MKKIISLAALLGGMLILGGCNYANTTNSTVPATTTPEVVVTTTTNAEVVVKITASGFSPEIVTVKSGTKVTFVNEDTKNHWPASNPHPTHTLLPGFDALGDLKTGESYAFKFEKVGTWKYHDHLNPIMTGAVVVTE